MIYSWICCQLGAREHYAIPRALHLNQQLKLLITDFWLPDSSPLNLLPKPWLSNLRQRHHPELDTAQVKSFNYQTVNYEFIARQKQLQGWDRIIDRNYWWQQQVIKQLDRTKLPDKQITLFAYSYAALEIFKYAQKRGWKLVLGQIDPGIIEEKLVYKIAQKYLNLQPKPELLPLQYWSNWRAECRLADRIIVNSDWSRQALEQTGISPQKITTIPLAYQATSSNFKRTYSSRFTPERPLKVLFLGQIIIRKGIGEILEAIALLNKSINPSLVE
ncbi:MAG: glycosyltransferase, partial [Cyanobacteria bacterium J06623_7]